ELDDLLVDESVLVDLDRVDALVPALVAVLGDGPLERLVQLDDPAAQNVREPDQQRQPNAATRDLVDQLFQIDAGAVRSGRVRLDVARFVNGEVAVPPVLDAVGFGGVADVPLAGDTRCTAHGAYVE